MARPDRAAGRRAPDGARRGHAAFAVGIDRDRDPCRAVRVLRRQGGTRLRRNHADRHKGPQSKDGLDGRRPEEPPMMAMPGRATATSGTDGFVLVAVLWILGALSALAAIFSIYVSNTALAVAVSDDAIRAEALTSASVELTAFQLLQAPAETRPTRGAFTF